MQRACKRSAPCSFAGEWEKFARLRGSDGNIGDAEPTVAIPAKTESRDLNSCSDYQSSKFHVIRKIVLGSGDTSEMQITKPDYDFESLKSITPKYRRKATIMREICSKKHEKVIFWESFRSYGTVATSIIVISLTFFGTTELATRTGITVDLWDWFFRFASLALVLISVWQLLHGKSQIAFIYYTSIREFSTIINMIEFVESAENMTKPKATDAASELITMYDLACRDIPRISNKEHASAKRNFDL